MAEFNAITLQSGIQKQIHAPDILIVGAGVDTDTAATLTVGGTNATALSLAKNTTVTGANTFSTGTGTVTVNGASTVFASSNVTASGSSSFDLSGGSGTFKTSTGAVTIGPGTVTVSGVSTFKNNVTIDGNVTIADGYAFTFGGVEGTASVNDIFTVFAGANSFLETEAGSWTIDGYTGILLQQNDTTYLDVGNTAPNIITVANGITLQATGTGQIIPSAVSNITATGINTSGTTIGFAVYISANDVASSADNSVLSTSYVIGFAKDSAASGNVFTNGVVTPVQSVVGSAGQVMYLDTGANAGKLTNVAPSVGVVAAVGVMLDATKMVIRLFPPTVL